MAGSKQDVPQSESVPGLFFLAEIIQTELVPAIKADLQGRQTQTSALVSALNGAQNIMQTSLPELQSLKAAIGSLNNKLDQSIGVDQNLAISVSALTNKLDDVIKQLQLLKYPIPSRPGAFGFQVVNNV